MRTNKPSFHQKPSKTKQFLRANNVLIDWIYQIGLLVLCVAASVACAWAFWSAPFVIAPIFHKAVLGKISDWMETIAKVSGNFERQVLCSRDPKSGFGAFIYLGLALALLTITLSLRCLWMMGFFLYGFL